jgi:glucose/arabinose dehydrogenase
VVSSGGALPTDGAMTLADAADDVALAPDQAGPNASIDTAVPGADVGTLPKNTCLGPVSAVVANAKLPAGYCAWIWARDLVAPRGIVRTANGDIVVVDQNSGRIILLYDDDRSGVSDPGERVVLVTVDGLNHGIAIAGGYLYASTATTVYRWPYGGDRQPLGNRQVVVSGLPDGGHSTRTLLFDREGRLYVSVGSYRNVDDDSSRARIVRFPPSALAAGATFAQGEVFADGLRNEVGLTLDSQGRVWGVENGRDQLSRTDLGGDIHDDNPAEELNLFAQPGQFYGYPYCWSEYRLAGGLGPRTQWADPAFMNDGIHTDAWCRNPANVVPPVVAMQAHSAPLDLKFYGGGAFPNDMNGSAIISFHGSWNRSPATGYKVVRIPFGPDGVPSGEPTSLLEYTGPGDTASDWPHRPVGIETGLDGRLYVTSDSSGVVIAIGYNPG